LLDAYDREDAYTREHVGAAVRAIMKRERIRRNAKILNVLAPEQRLTLEAILPRLPARARRPVRPRRSSRSRAG